MIEIFSKRINFKAIGAYIAAIAICSVLLIWVMKLWQADLRIPFTYVVDALINSVWIKGVVDNGWYLQNSFIGMPFGNEMYDFPLSNNLDFLIIKLISIFAPNYALTMNIYFLITFPLTTLTSMFVLRQLKFSYATSMLGSLLFTFIPYHFWRGETHLFLAAYYIIPLIIMVILWIYTDKDFLFAEINGKMRLNLLNQKSIIAIIVCILISSTFIYYPIFSCFFLAVIGITSSIFHKNKRYLIISVILIALITIGVLINVSPTLIYQHENGKNPETAIRSPLESELYGLKIVQLLMPIRVHRIPFIAKISETYSATAPLVNENSFASLGIIGSIGFLILIAWAFYRISNGLRAKADNLLNELNALSMLNLSAVLLATIGGFGSLFAYLITPQIRCYDRISIFIAFFALYAIVLLMEKFSRKYVKSNTSRLLFNVFIGLVLVVGILDQTSSSFAPPYASTKAEFLNDENFINNIEAIMPENAMIFQLPYVPFPEYPPVNKMTDYTHFRAYLHSKDLRWSYGAMKGRPEAEWQRAVAGSPVIDMVKQLSSTGFNGIYVDSYGYKDDGVEIISELANVLGVKPIVSADNRLYFFDMTTYNEKYNEKFSNTTGPKPITSFYQGWYGLENWTGVPTRWMEGDASLLLYSDVNWTANLSLKAVSFYSPKTLEVYVGNKLTAQVPISSTEFINVTRQIHLSKGSNIIGLHVPEGCDRPSDKPELNNADPRCLSLAVQNITLS